jgi:hypothetical protein
MNMHSALLAFQMQTDRRTDRNKRTKVQKFCISLPNSPSHSHTVNVYCCRLLCKQTVPVMFSSLLHRIFTVKILYKLCRLQLNCTYSNYTQLLLHVQLHNSTAHLLYKYCTNCTVYSSTVLTVITHSCCHMFSCTTAQHIYSTNTVQTVQPPGDLYLQ